ncbi:MAG: VTT domain-containing protein [Myxococcota bacterium]
MSPKQKKVLRIGGVVAFFAIAWLTARHFGLVEHFSADGIRGLVASAGAFGILVYIGAFSLGSLMQIPGAAFLVAARVAFGPVIGVAVAYVGALAAISIGFVTFRGLGGKSLADVRWGKLGAQLDDRPVRTMVLLRTFMMISPPLTAALAMSKLRFRDHLVGSAIGLVLPVTLWVLASGPVLECLGWS